MKQKCYVVYQPIVDIKSQETYGREVLLRGNFLPEILFKQASKQEIVEFDRVSRRLALTHFHAEKEKLFINCHPVSLLSDHTLFEDLLEYPFTHNVILEVTEQDEVNNLLLKQKLEDLKNLGVEIAIDDFGSGYSNFNLIYELETKYVKLDKSLVKNIKESKKVRAIIKGMVNLMGHVNITLIAEGIETNEQKKILLDCGVVLGQGFLLGHPSPLVDIY